MNKPNLTENGWELEINPVTVPFQIDQFIKIVVVHISPDETDDPIKSVIKDPLWIKIETTMVDGYIGTIKTAPEHNFTVKDDTKFSLNHKIFFAPENIFAVK